MADQLHTLRLRFQHSFFARLRAEYHAIQRDDGIIQDGVNSDQIAKEATDLDRRIEHLNVALAVYSDQTNP